MSEAVVCLSFISVGFATLCIVLNYRNAKLEEQLSQLMEELNQVNKTWKFCLEHIEDLKKEPARLEEKNQALSDLLYQMRQTLRKMKGRGIAECQTFPSNDWVYDAVLKRTNRGLKKTS